MLLLLDFFTDSNLFQMKRIIFLLFFVGATLSLSAQNLQLHYDLGRSLYNELDETADSDGRAPLTTTFEMFRPDKVGSTYLFVDMDYDDGVSGAYWELSREFCFWQESKWNWLSLHVEYNGGMNRTVGSFNDAYLLGATYSGHSADFGKTWSLSVMYKHIPHTVDKHGDKAEANFQVTGVWGIALFGGRATFSGFFDFWRECRPWQGTSHIFLSEPQLWYNFNKGRAEGSGFWSVGAECELSNNFVGEGFYAIPTLAVKWTF